MRKSIVSIVLLLAILSTLTFTFAQHSSANPIGVGLTEDGSALHKGEFIHMPTADVKINITRISNTVTVDTFGIYEIETNQTQNTSLAYVYPSFADTSPENNMTIYVDSVDTEFTVLTWAEIVELNFSEDLSDYTPIIADFAYFDVSLTADTTLNLQVSSHYTFTLGDVLYWDYRYIFGSARSFEGNTSEIIHIHLVEETPFLGTSFYPDDYLVETQDGIVTDAIWEFNVSSMESNYVSFTGQVNPYNDPGLVPSLVIIVIILGVAVYAVYYIQKKTAR